MIGYREGSYIWRYSAAITVDARAWVSGAAEVTVTIPSQWDAFWSTVNATDARDVRILDADGRTLITAYKVIKTGGAAIDATAITNRDGTIQISGWTPPAAAMCRLVLVWGSSAASAFGAPTSVSPLTGYIALPVPSVGWRAEPEPPGATKPRARLTKGASEVLVVGVTVAALLASRKEPQAQRRGHDAIRYASYAVQTGGASQAGMVEAASVRFIGEDTVTMLVKAGSSGTDYTIIPTITLYPHASGYSAPTLIPRALLSVRDVAE